MSATILIVDDNATNMKLARHVLQSAGYIVQQAKDAESALTLIRARPPQLVLMDIQLPVMDGLALARLIKDDDSIKHVCIVAFTACAMMGDEKRALAAGCDGYITKPIDVAKFPDQVAGFLDGQTKAITDL